MSWFYPFFIYALGKFFSFIYNQPDFVMEIVDKNFKNGFVSAFQYAVKVMSCNLYVPFLETCKSYGFCPAGLNLKKKLFIEFESDDLIIFWKQTLLSVENDLLEALCVGICERMFFFFFWKKRFGKNCRNSIKITQQKI